LRRILRTFSGQHDEWVGSFALPRSSWLVPVDRWFNLTKLQVWVWVWVWVEVCVCSISVSEGVFFILQPPLICQQISSIPVRTLASWHTVSGGEIDLALVPTKPHGCLPYHPHCETTAIKHGVSLNRCV
jgi:hypothetical protein